MSTEERALVDEHASSRRQIVSIASDKQSVQYTPASARILDELVTMYVTSPHQTSAARQMPDKDTSRQCYYVYLQLNQCCYRPHTF